MTETELYRILRHCHKALGDSLTVIGDLLNQQGNPDTIIQTIEAAQKKYNTITRLLTDIENAEAG